MDRFFSLYVWNCAARISQWRDETRTYEHEVRSQPPLEVQQLLDCLVLWLHVEL